MTKKTLLILAGYSGVGKTTLLIEAHKRGLPLFGKDAANWFQNVNLPQTFPEHEADFKNILKHRSWFAETHLPSLGRLDIVPDFAVLHIDLNQLASKLSVFPDGEAQEKKLVPRTIRSLSDDQQNEVFFRNALSNPFFTRFDHIVVNTLYAPWEVISHQWHARRILRKKPSDNASFLSNTFSGMQAMLRQARQRVLNCAINLNHDRPLKRKRYLFDFKTPGEDIHRSVYKAWYASIAAIFPESSLVTQVQQAKVVIRKGDEVIYEARMDVQDSNPSIVGDIEYSNPEATGIATEPV